MAHGRKSFRLIPARAGNTSRRAQLRPRRTAHPRSRGEHQPLSRTVRVRGGSSPLARGTRFPGAAEHGWVRLIPARAGNTVKAATSPMPTAGSSPLARGTPGFLSSLINEQRLIPARAGNTFGVPESTFRGSAHPRSRGEHSVSRVSSNAGSGSSPLARGTQGRLLFLTLITRLIPARAGNTGDHWRQKGQHAAHPRSRGEHEVETPVQMPETWLIPARAGNTGQQQEQAGASAAHPRSRGEHHQAR